MRRGQLGRKHSEGAKAKIGRAHRGKIVSEQTKEKLRIANLGKHQSLEAREKNRRAQIGNQRALGNKLNKEVRAYLSSIRKGVPWSDKRRQAYELRWGNSGDIQNARI